MVIIGDMTALALLGAVVASYFLYLGVDRYLASQLPKRKRKK